MECFFPTSVVQLVSDTVSMLIVLMHCHAKACRFGGSAYAQGGGGDAGRLLITARVKLSQTAPAWQTSLRLSWSAWALLALANNSW